MGELNKVEPYHPNRILKHSIEGAPLITWGCDPEFFIVKDGKVVGAERVIPKDKGFRFGTHPSKPDDYRGAFVLDGVQAELTLNQPYPYGCRESFGTSIAEAFKALNGHLKSNPGFKAEFLEVIDIDKDELDSLSDQAKVFGCAPSKNYHEVEPVADIDARSLLTRAAGGHIHMGLGENSVLMNNRERLIPILDILVGNTCVMMDRDPRAAERRKYYGRAGEYRLPKHGVEYRTLSNFWLRDYKILHLICGLCKLSVGVLNQSVRVLPIRPPKLPVWTPVQYDTYYPPHSFERFDAEKELFSRVNMTLIEDAINKNDLELAKHNYYNGIRQFIEDYTQNQGSTGLCAKTLEPFDFFLQMIEENGLDYWFKNRGIKAWTKEVLGNGSESFLDKTVREKMEEFKKTGKVPRKLTESEKDRTY